MIQRIVLGALSIMVILGIVLLDVGTSVRLAGTSGPLPDLLRRGSAIPVVLLLLFLAGGRELDRLLRGTGANPHSGFAYFMMAVLMVSPWLSAAGWLGQKPVHLEGLYWQVVWLAATVVGLGVLTVARRIPEGSLRDGSATMLMIMYLGFAGSFAIHIRCGRGSGGPSGAWLLLMVVLVTKASDIGAYLVGTLIGRHKLIPSISPGKSIEGTIAGCVTSALVGMGLASLNSNLSSIQMALVGDSNPGPVTDSRWFVLSEAARSFSLNIQESGLSSAWRGFLLGLALAIVGQFGDLFESCFKRDAGAKDSGKVLPRFGGILDLIDSPVLAFPVAWFLLTELWGVI